MTQEELEKKIIEIIKKQDKIIENETHKASRNTKEDVLMGMLIVWDVLTNNKTLEY